MRCALSCFFLFTNSEFLHFMKASRLAPAGGVTVIKSRSDQISKPTKAMKVLKGLYACEQHQKQPMRNVTSQLCSAPLTCINTAHFEKSCFFLHQAFWPFATNIDIKRQGTTIGLYLKNLINQIIYRHCALSQNAQTVLSLETGKGLTHHVDKVDNFKHPLSQLRLISLELFILKQQVVISEKSYIPFLSSWIIMNNSNDFYIFSEFLCRSYLTIISNKVELNVFLLLENRWTLKWTEWNNKALKDILFLSSLNLKMATFVFIDHVIMIFKDLS